MKILFQFFIVGIMSAQGSIFNDIKNNSQVVEFSKIVKEEKALGLDVRSLKEFEKNGSSLALHIPILELSKRISELDKTKTILVFCESGGRSLLAKKLLQMNGFNNVVNIRDWRTWNKVVSTDLK
jgi:rhodanese-related sulfurtransferase